MPEWQYMGSGPASKAAVITPHNTNDLSVPCRMIYVGGAGDITLIPRGGAVAVLFKAVPVGTILPVSASRVLATGTTATSLLALN